MCQTFTPPKSSTKVKKCPKRGGGGKFFLEIFLLRPNPIVLGQVWVQKSKKNFFLNYRLGAIEENQFFGKFSKMGYIS